MRAVVIPRHGGPEVLEVLHEDADRLRAQTGRTFDHWSV